MKFALILTYAFLFFVAFDLSGQSNVGVGTDTPTEKLEVSGIIYTNQGGVRFPDETLQETAAFMADPENAGTPNGRVFVIIAPLDTIWLLDISAGGIINPENGAAMAEDYRMIKEMDKSSPALLELIAGSTQLPEVRMYFTNSEDQVYQTIELRDAEISEFSQRTVYQGNGTYAHLENLEFIYDAIEIKFIDPDGPDPCFCYNFVSHTSCSCN